MSNIADYVDAIELKLAGVTALSALGDEQLARHKARRSYTWLLAHDDFEAPAGAGKDGRQVKNRVATFVVRCWGKTRAEAEMLRAALITAAGRTLGGYSEKSIRVGRAEWYGRADNQDGFAVDQTLGLVVPFKSVDLPAGPPPVDAPDRVHTTALINARAIEGATFEETP